MEERHEVTFDDPRDLRECVHNVGAAASDAAETILRLYLSMPDPEAPELGPGDREPDDGEPVH